MLLKKFSSYLASHFGVYQICNVQAQSYFYKNQTGPKILLGPGILVKLATYKLSLFTFCLPSQGRQTQHVGCKFGLNTRTKQNLVWTLPKCSGPDQIELDLTKNELDSTKMIWAVQNHFVPIKGQGIRAQEPFYPVNTLIL